MDIQDYQALEGDALKERIRAIPRTVLDEQINQFGVQHSLLCQRLEAVFGSERTDQFIAVRPGGLDEIDKAIQKADPANTKELSILKSFRELNRVLLPFMDVYEEHVLSDIQYMATNDLNALLKEVSKQLRSATTTLSAKAPDYRQEQNAGGTLRLAILVKNRIETELKSRSGPSAGTEFEVI